jgi:hypothetical protein
MFNISPPVACSAPPAGVLDFSNPALKLDDENVEYPMVLIILVSS